MRKFIFVLILIPIVAIAQSGDTVKIAEKLFKHKQFVYEQDNLEYVTNENGYFLDVINDTMYLFFDSVAPRTYKLQYFKDPYGKIIHNKIDTFKKIGFVIKFDENGKVEQLVNWKTHRDLMVSKYSLQRKLNIINPDRFEELKKQCNDEIIIRRAMINDIVQMFNIFGDTFNENDEYLRLKTLNSPFSNLEFNVLGNLTIKKQPTSKYSYFIHTQNRLASNAKQALREEAKTYMIEKSTDPKVPLPEVFKVDLNNEQEFIYNRYLKLIMSCKISDVLVINDQSRANIRSFILRDKK